MKTLIRFGKANETTGEWFNDKAKDLIVDDFIIRESICVGGTTYQIMEVSSVIGDPEVQTQIIVLDRTIIAP